MAAAKNSAKAEAAGAAKPDGSDAPKTDALDLGTPEAPETLDDETPEVDVEPPGAEIPLGPHRLEAPYAYYTEANDLKAWGQGHIVEDPEEIRHLIERGARMVEVKP